MRSIALLTNPDSGAGEAEEVARCLRRLGVNLTGEFRLAEVDEALATSPQRLVVAGGDGSLGCVAAPAARAAVPIALIPTGTANDFARRLSIPRERVEACRLAASGERTRRVDLAWTNSRPYLNVASIGLPPAAADHASGLKSALGPVAYLVGAVRAGLGSQPVRCRVRGDDEELYSGHAWQVTVACSGAFGAGSEIEADPSDGRLDVVVIEAGSRARLPLYAYALRTGGLEDRAGVRKLRCKTAEIELPRRESFNVDGEIVEQGSCRFEVEPGALQVVVA